MSRKSPTPIEEITLATVPNLRAVFAVTHTTGERFKSRLYNGWAGDVWREIPASIRPKATQRAKPAKFAPTSPESVV